MYDLGILDILSWERTAFRVYWSFNGCIVLGLQFPHYIDAFFHNLSLTHFFPTEVSIALSRPTFLAPELWNFLATLASVSENGKYSTGLGMGLRIPRFWLQPGFCGGERSKGGEIIFGFQPSLLPYPLLPAQVLSEFRTLIAPQKAPPKMIYSLQPFPGEHPE